MAEMMLSEVRRTEKKNLCLVCEKLQNAKHLTANGLDCCFGLLYKSGDASLLLAECERSIKYFEGKLSRIKVYGKYHQIPRKQCSFGDPGLKYTFSGVTIPANPWPPFLAQIRDRISDICGWKFNFVLCNRYKDGTDYIAEHKDDERDLVQEAPIASLSFGWTRDFVLRHEAVKNKKTIKPPNSDAIKLELKSGWLLVMNHPTNRYWYHSLPVRKKVPGVRINFTFRVMKTGTR